MKLKRSYRVTTNSLCLFYNTPLSSSLPPTTAPSTIDPLLLLVHIFTDSPLSRHSNAPKVSFPYNPSSSRHCQNDGNIDWNNWAWLGMSELDCLSYINSSSEGLTVSNGRCNVNNRREFLCSYFFISYLPNSPLFCRITLLNYSPLDIECITNNIRNSPVT